MGKEEKVVCVVRQEKKEQKATDCYMRRSCTLTEEMEEQEAVII